MTAPDTARRVELLAQIAAVWGEDRVEEALELAVEAGKSALTAEQIEPLQREHAWLDLAGILPTREQTFRDWTLQHGLVSAEVWQQADEVDLLGMNDDPRLALLPDGDAPEPDPGPTLAARALGGDHDLVLETIVALWGVDRVGTAFEFAAQGGRLALSPEDLVPLARAWQWLGILDMRPAEGDGFYAWSRQHRLVSDAEWEEARKAGVLKPRPSEECPVVSPTDGEKCIRELHHPHRHVDENGWVW